MTPIPNLGSPSLQNTVNFDTSANTPANSAKLPVVQIRSTAEYLATRSEDLSNAPNEHKKYVSQSRLKKADLQGGKLNKPATSAKDPLAGGIIDEQVPSCSSSGMFDPNALYEELFHQYDKYDSPESSIGENEDLPLFIDTESESETLPAQDPLNEPPAPASVSFDKNMAINDYPINDDGHDAVQQKPWENRAEMERRTSALRQLPLGEYCTYLMRGKQERQQLHDLETRKNQLLNFASQTRELQVLAEAFSSPTEDLLVHQARLTRAIKAVDAQKRAIFTRNGIRSSRQKLHWEVVAKQIRESAFGMLKIKGHRQSLEIPKETLKSFDSARVKLRQAKHVLHQIQHDLACASRKLMQNPSDQAAQADVAMLITRENFAKIAKFEAKIVRDTFKTRIAQTLGIPDDDQLPTLVDLIKQFNEIEIIADKMFADGVRIAESEQADTPEMPRQEKTSHTVQNTRQVTYLPFPAEVSSSSKPEPINNNPIQQEQVYTVHLPAFPDIPKFTYQGENGSLILFEGGDLEPIGSNTYRKRRYDFYFQTKKFDTFNNLMISSTQITRLEKKLIKLQQESNAWFGNRAKIQEIENKLTTQKELKAAKETARQLKNEAAKAMQKPRYTAYIKKVDEKVLDQYSHRKSRQYINRQSTIAKSELDRKVALAILTLWDTEFKKRSLALFGGECPSTTIQLKMQQVDKEEKEKAKRDILAMGSEILKTSQYR